MTTVKPGCYQRKRRTAWSACGLGDGRSVGRFVCCAACVLSSCDIGGGCVSTTHQHTLVARGGLGLARNTHRHTYTYYTHYSHTHTGTHTHTTHTHTHTTHKTHNTHTTHNTHNTHNTHRPGTPGVLPGCSQGTHGVRRRYLCTASDPRYRGCGRAQAERPQPTALLTASAARVPFKFARVPSCGNRSVVSAEVWEGPCDP